MALVFSLNAKSQIKPGTYSVQGAERIPLSLVLSERFKFELYDTRGSYVDGITWGDWAIHMDTLLLIFKTLQIRKDGDTSHRPVEYTDLDGRVLTINNCNIVTIIKRYIVSDSVLLLIRDSLNNKSPDWRGRNFDFVYKTSNQLLIQDQFQENAKKTN